MLVNAIPQLTCLTRPISIFEIRLILFTLAMNNHVVDKCLVCV